MMPLCEQNFAGKHKSDKKTNDPERLGFAFPLQQGDPFVGASDTAVCI